MAEDTFAEMFPIVETSPAIRNLTSDFSITTIQLPHFIYVKKLGNMICPLFVLCDMFREVTKKYILFDC